MKNSNRTNFAAEFKLYESLFSESSRKLVESKPTKPYSEADFAWDDKTILADFKRAALAYMNGTDIDTAIHDLKVMIISQGSEWTYGDEGLVYKKHNAPATASAVSNSATSTASVSPMYIIAPNGNAGGNIYYMCRDLTTAQKHYKKDARDFVRHGMGGGDTAIELYEYTGDPVFFNKIYNEWKANNTDFNVDIEELGFNFADCKTLESVIG